MRGYAHRALGVAVGWLFWITVLYAVLLADKYHWLDWSGLVGGHEVSSVVEAAPVGR